MQAQPQRVTAAMFAAKYRSKKEVFQFLTVECQAYLCPYENLTIYFLKDLTSGQKNYVRCESVKYLFCPQYEGLNISEILNKALLNPELIEYLPDEQDRAKIPRQWLINVAYTVIGQPFQDWVNSMILARNEKIATERNLMIDLDPQIAQMFHQSTAVSTSKGISAHMLKAGSKRRRTQAQIKGARHENEIMELVQNEEQSRIEELESALKEAKDEASNNQAAAQILSGLIEAGDAELAQDGSVSVSKKRPVPNEIMNEPLDY